MDIAEFKKLPILGILRGIKETEIEPLTETVISSGLKTIEITMDTEGASSLIRRMKNIAGNSLTIGAGTVLDITNLKNAVDSGASFIVSPVFVEEVVEYCRKQKIPVFPGAFTPTEIYHAWQNGATMVKVFPAKSVSPGYFQEIKGPFRDIELLACGGVNEKNIRSFFEYKADAVAFGTSIFRSDLIAAKEFSTIRNAIERLIDRYRHPLTD
ncbi:MAG: bifunctional 4-hydroxy-2-oxoglutarate aldolase/2-dehydro-3-deoxy-phosphogluconate aldolase [Candidatus Omnitrophica bacterium]|nr:bifunctional 4-hydroxy-2-oxoglutarate aldolase/2-dehydro-3-deoxy-phosphogluconate aldolase [Candidatus Omnitrophota bacterium]